MKTLIFDLWKMIEFTLDYDLELDEALRLMVSNNLYRYDGE